ncbi:Uncharacterised protein [Yersinia pseudotuberculosis]|nr:Uncharacterised protein [Yersinia pseudotuberculosis]CNI88208.1 Uncharacterised protein [Yersinia pseudotuberculosis]CNJ24489.1 Uncharacterised protein [Yersinia pseudotuberculosis]
MFIFRKVNNDVKAKAKAKAKAKDSNHGQISRKPA